MGREYPNDPALFHIRVHNAFYKNRQETDPVKIEEHIAKGIFSPRDPDCSSRTRYLVICYKR